MSATITLDHPVDVNGIAIRFVPIRPPTDADRKTAKRAFSRKWGGEDRKLLTVIAATIDAEDPEREQKVVQAFVGCALVREVTGLPFSAIAQLDSADDAKIGVFLNDIIKA